MAEAAFGELRPVGVGAFPNDAPERFRPFGSGAKMLPDQNGPGGPTRSSGCKLMRDRVPDLEGKKPQASFR